MDVVKKADGSLGIIDGTGTNSPRTGSSNPGYGVGLGGRVADWDAQSLGQYYDRGRGGISQSRSLVLLIWRLRHCDPVRPGAELMQR